jgi:hypothetical protein
LSNIPRVSGVKAAHITTTEHDATNSSSSIECSGAYGSLTNTSTPNGGNSLANARPIRPNPTIPTRRPKNVSPSLTSAFVLTTPSRISRA